jgi:hypothetical protein
MARRWCWPYLVLRFRKIPLDHPSFMGLRGSIAMDDFQFGLNELFVGEM